MVGGELPRRQYSSPSQYGGKQKQDQTVRRYVAKKTYERNEQIKQPYRYEGDIAGLKLTKGLIDPNQDLSKYEIEYYEDGITPKTIKAGEKSYVSNVYGESVRDKDNYYQNVWNFDPQGKISQYQQKYDYKDHRGQVGNTSYYSRGVSDKEKWGFSDGMLASVDKYNTYRTGDNDWSAESYYTGKFDRGQKTLEVDRQWSNKDQNWFKVTEKDYTTGQMYVDQDFMSFAPKPKAPPVLSSRVIYEEIKTPQGGVIGLRPVTGITTYKDTPESKGLVQIKNFLDNTSNFGYTGNKKQEYAQNISIPELNIKTYDEQREEERARNLFLLKKNNQTENKQSDYMSNTYNKSANQNQQSVVDNRQSFLQSQNNNQSYIPKLNMQTLVPLNETQNNMLGTMKNNINQTLGMNFSWSKANNINTGMNNKIMNNSKSNYSNLFKIRNNNTNINTTKKNYLNGKI